MAWRSAGVLGSLCTVFQRPKKWDLLVLVLSWNSLGMGFSKDHLQVEDVLSRFSLFWFFFIKGIEIPSSFLSIRITLKQLQYMESPISGKGGRWKRIWSKLQQRRQKTNAGLFPSTLLGSDCLWRRCFCSFSLHLGIPRLAGTRFGCHLIKQKKWQTASQVTNPRLVEIELSCFLRMIPSSPV